MVNFFLGLLAASLVPLASAHYSFDVLVVDGIETEPGQYVRLNTRSEKYMPTKFINSFDNVTPLSNDFRCNLGASSGSGVGIAEVAAGSGLAMKLSVGATMQHPGPAFVYMSKSPGNVTEYAGDGDWFKIHEEGLCNSGDITTTAWCTWDKDRISFTVPNGTPAGEYLVRVEHIGLHGAHNGEAEFYYACAQVKVTGNGSGTPGPTVKIPGIYSADDASVNFSIWSDNTDYPMPEPAVWPGGSSSSGSNQEQSAQNSSSVTQQIAQPTSTEETVPVSTEEALGAKASGEASSGCRARRRTRRGHQNIHAGYRR
ncbi:hypothetical protein NM208_g7143 [Fusarium decemcellulare]|uniref:Uncharacterized protein n=1 Tax=Fusarium decemcellulare TaxID=57161 RepID=A0ACC1SA84_9HYPO|nr:hypothetical protein NM208_g7143 [Fusarium decemcellulare]